MKNIGIKLEKKYLSQTIAVNTQVQLQLKEANCIKLNMTLVAMTGYFMKNVCLLNAI